MKLVKLSLVAALAAGAFSVANAAPLDEVIKDVDLSGVLRYRYDNGNIDKEKGYGFDSRGIESKQAHKFRAQLNFQAAIADNFKAFIQTEYHAADAGFENFGTSNTATGINVRQYYFTYTQPEVDTSIILGKQQINSIWTDNGIDGLVGTGAKIVNTSVDGLVLAAYAFDSFNAKFNGNGGTEADTVLSSDQYFYPSETDANGKVTKTVGLNFNPYDHNLYGVAAIAAYDVFGGSLKPQLWVAYQQKTATYYALDVAYSMPISADFNLGLEGLYMGNAIEKNFKHTGLVETTVATGAQTLLAGTYAGRDLVGNGNLFALKAKVDGYGFDAALGGVYFGQKGKFTLNTLEDHGNIDHMLGGFEMYYTAGSNLNGDIGRNTFGYVQFGYTFNEVLRTGIDFVYGTTSYIPKFQAIDDKDTKFEIVPSISYNYSPKLNFKAWYSYIDIDGGSNNIAKAEGQKHTVRLQALYKF